jgi:hypothetical protein
VDAKDLSFYRIDLFQASVVSFGKDEPTLPETPGNSEQITGREKKQKESEIDPQKIRRDMLLPSVQTGGERDPMGVFPSPISRSRKRLIHRKRKKEKRKTWGWVNVPSLLLFLSHLTNGDALVNRVSLSLGGGSFGMLRRSSAQTIGGGGLTLDLRIGWFKEGIIRIAAELREISLLDCIQAVDCSDT